MNANKANTSHSLLIPPSIFQETTSCSPGFFGDCTHPEVQGSAGRNLTSEVAPVESFQNVPIFQKIKETQQDDPRDYPEPFIQHFDPALDLDYDYEYYDSDVVDAEPSASNLAMRNNQIKRSPATTWGNSMTSALSAVASLANIPFDNPSSATDNGLKRIETKHEPVDRAFIARPPRRRPSPQRKASGSNGFFQIPFFQGAPKKSIGPAVNHIPGHRQNFIQFHRPVQQHPRPNINHRLEKFNPNPVHRQPVDVFEQEDPFLHHEESVRQTTPDTFRPSSLITDDPDDFQPVTPASKPPSTAARESNFARPHREANHQTRPGGSTSFQSFSPTGQTFSHAGTLPLQEPFVVPQSSPRPQGSSFLPTPKFPSSGNFVFNQPPIHPGIFNRPLSPVTPPPGSVFSRPPTPQQHVQNVGRPFVHHQQPQVFNHPPTVNQQPQTFARPPVSPVHGQSFSLHNNPQSFVRPTFPPHLPPAVTHTTQPQHDQIFIHSTSPSPLPPRPPPTPHRIHNFGQPVIIHEETSFNQPTSGLHFAQLHNPHENVHRFSSSTLPPFRSPTLSQQERPTLSEHPVQPAFVHPELHEAVTPATILSSTPSFVHPENPFAPQGAFHSPQQFVPEEDFVSPAVPTSIPAIHSIPGVPSAPGTFAFSKEILKESDQPADQIQQVAPATEAPLPDQRPATRRRPIASRRPGQAVRRPGASQSARDAARIRIRGRTTTPTPTTVAPLITGLENSQFHNQFIPEDGGWPNNLRLHHELEGVTNTEFEPEEDHRLDNTGFGAPSQNNAPSQDYEDHRLGNTRFGAPSQNNAPSQDYDEHRGIPKEINEVVEAPKDYEYNVQDRVPEYVDYQDYDNVPTTTAATTTTSTTTTTTTTTTTPAPQTTPRFRGPLLRRRPGIRERLRTRTTTPKPTTEGPDEDYVNSPEVTNPPTQERTTTLSPFRQRIRDRLKRLRSQPNSNTETTTPLTTEKDENIVTSPAPPPRVTRRRFDPDRYQRFREMIRKRNKNRIKEINNKSEEGSDNEDDVGATESPNTDFEVTRPSVQNRQINRFRTATVESTEENVLLVREITGSDLETQETSQDVVKEEFPQEENQATGDPTYDDNAEETDNSAYEDYSAEPEQLEETRPVESPAHDDGMSDNEGTERKITNPNFRARFREFLKNRRDRVSARYSTTPSPEGEEERDIGPPKEDEGHVDFTHQSQESRGRSFSSRSSVEDLPEKRSMSIKEKLEEISRNRQEARAKLLANREHLRGERLSRRIPIRPGSTNKLLGPQKDETTSDSEINDKETTPESLAGFQSVEITQDKTREIFAEENAHDGSSEVPSARPLVQVRTNENRFIPSIGKPLTVFKSQEAPEEDEPVIITAPPPIEDGDVVMSVRVSANLGGSPSKSSIEEGREATLAADSDVTYSSDQVEQEESEDEDLSLAQSKIQEVTFEQSDEKSRGIQADHSLESEQEVSTSTTSVPDYITSVPLTTTSSAAPEYRTEPSTTTTSAAPEFRTTGPSTTTSSALPSLIPLASTPSMTRPSEEEESDSDSLSKPSVPRVSKPTFQLRPAGHKREDDHVAISASDYSGEDTVVTPVPFFTITMSTDEPMLPLERLMPFFGRQ
ncbi:uncharacterized protein LOC125046983 [Penaeus chinensis]|uniref:uncharacterized protein LOC125046983 n=1 Tax=Penaeus chinensis TaxID=139456 RepID=UPI001FB635C4|nr:uncharacterized protein LOC125046983 [Penaeus chinensis]